jgi:hypothetical protein
MDTWDVDRHNDWQTGDLVSLYSFISIKACYEQGKYLVHRQCSPSHNELSCDNDDGDIASDGEEERIDAS